MNTNALRAAGPDPLMSIGEFARRSHLSAGALRLYDREGLLLPAEVDESSGYRRYRESQLERARLVSLLRRLDMPLEEVSIVLVAAPDKAARLVAAHWSRLEYRAAAQRELARHIREHIFGESETTMYQIEQRESPEQTLLTFEQHVYQAELADFLTRTVTQLEHIADEHKVARGELILICHGQISDDSDGPVEVCLPVDAPIEDRTGLRTRVEPAHREAFVRLTKAQLVYPAVLSAYDAVFTWVREQGRTRTGSPREVYLGYFPTAAPEDEICDVSVPFR